MPVLWVRGFFVATAFLGGFGLMLYAGLWMFLPADQRFEVSAPGLESATRTGKRPGRRLAAARRRSGDRAGGAALRRRARLRGHLRPGRALLAGRPRRRRHRAAVAPGRRGPARALDRLHRAHRPVPGDLRQRRLGGLRPDRRRPRPDRHRPDRLRRRGRQGHLRGAGAGRRPARARSAWPSSSARGRCGWSTTSAPSAPSASAPRSAPTWPPTCTTRCCRPSP